MRFRGRRPLRRSGKRGVGVSAGFTLIEVMIALSVSVLVLGGTAMVMVQMVRLWRDATAQWELAQQARVARERVLRGLDGCYGIREADTNTWCANNQIWFHAENGMPGGQQCVVYVNSSDELKSYTFSGDPPKMLNREGVKTEVAGIPAVFSLSNGVITCTFSNTYALMGKTYSHIQVVTTRIINE